MAKNYSITFVSLRTATTYTVHIGGGTGTEVPLNGGTQPFMTQEDDSEDMFTPIRTQSGYIRIIDDGKDANGNAFDWKDLIPATDTARPVTLTHDSGGHATVDWVGFMQAQDFGNVLYGNPQEREFPIQCVLTVTQGTDINYQQTSIQNFAYLLKQALDAIPSAQRPTQFYIQGGADAQAWLLKKIDWQNFVSEDGDGDLEARYTMYQCLEDMCSFWGWTARTKAQAMYLTCADDSIETKWLYLTYSTLTQLASYTSGTIPGDTTDTFLTASLSGDIFTSVNNDEYVQRGYNKSIVTADTNRGDDDVMNVFDDKTVKAMKDRGEQSQMIHNVVYTNDLLNVDGKYLKIQCRSGYASLNTGRFGYASDAQYVNVIRIKKTGGNNVTPFVQMETVYEHNYSDGFLMMYGTTYRYTDRYEDPYEGLFIGRSYMFAKIGIGRTRATASWWNGQSWQTTETFCRIAIGNKPNPLDGSKDEFPFLYLQATSASTDDWGCNILPISGLYGKLFFDLLGTNNDRVEEIDGERSFELCDVKITFQRNAGVIKHGSASDFYKIEENDRPTRFSYKSSNGNSVRSELNIDCIYATENACKFCYGEIFNPDGTLITSVPYGLYSYRPEQHLADRVTSFWQTSRRRLSVELRRDLIADITPRHKVTIDGMTGYPIAISREWRDDVTQLTIIQL